MRTTILFVVINIISLTGKGIEKATRQLFGPKIVISSITLKQSCPNSYDYSSVLLFFRKGKAQQSRAMLSLPHSFIGLGMLWVQHPQTLLTVHYQVLPGAKGGGKINQKWSLLLCFNGLKNSLKNERLHIAKCFLQSFSILYITLF